MKKLFLSLALVFGMVATAAAQVNVGGRVAGTMSTFKGDASDGAPWGVGFNAGVAAKYGINEMIAVAPEVGIDFRRVADDESTISFWVLNIPVLARISPVAGLYVEAGPTIGFILSSDVSVDEPSVDEEDMGDFDMSGVSFDMDMEADSGEGAMGDKTNTLEFGLAFGVGYSVMPNLDVNFRFAMGLTNVYEDIDLGPLGSFEIDMQNMQMSLGVTYWFM